MTTVFHVGLCVLLTVQSALLFVLFFRVESLERRANRLQRDVWAASPAQIKGVMVMVSRN